MGYESKPVTEEMQKSFNVWDSKFDVFSISSEILDLVREPAEPNEQYNDVEVMHIERIRTKRGESLLILQLKTQQNTWITDFMSIEPNHIAEASEKLRIINAGVGLKMEESSYQKLKGKRVNVYYDSSWPPCTYSIPEDLF